MKDNVKTSKDYKQELEEALNDQFLRRTLDKFAVDYRISREAVFSEIDGKDIIKKVADAKDDACQHMEELYAKFKEEAEKRGVIVHRAKDAKEANEIIAEIAKKHEAKKIIKSKSMTAEEIHLNHRLEKDECEVTETDLGEWLIQLRHEGPSHMVMPAIHLSRYQVADDLSKVTGEKYDAEDIQRLVKVARVELRSKFIEGEIGISGANFCIAENGTFGIATNEGNARMVTTLPKVHIALAGLDKLIPDFETALTALTVLPRNATGQRITSYVTFINGAGECRIDDENKKELHVVFLDNGRTEIAKDPLFKQVFRCVRCGACANVCPVFRMVGGHKMGHIYIGAIGLILTYFFHGKDKAAILAQNCIGCESCKDICAGGIDLPRLITEIRNKTTKEAGQPMQIAFVGKIMQNRKLFHKLLKFARFSQKPVKTQDGFIRHLPDALFGKHQFKSLPALADKAFREIYAEHAYTLENPKMRIALFAGCAQDFIFPDHLVAFMKLMKAHNVQVDFPEEQTCCGLPLQMLALQEVAADIARQNVKAIDASKYDYIVTLCASCASHLSHNYKNFIGDECAEFSSKVKDFSSFMNDVVKLDPSLFNKSSEKVTLHIPCHQARSLGVIEQPRNLIAQVADYAPAKEEASCCGFGGTYSAKFPEISKELLGNKIRRIEETEAERIVTDCPGCTMQIRGGLHKKGSSVKVTHIAELLADNLKK
ncbi:MAG TPA: (Fe-S)-binding protein [Desulfovibrio sp.]|nr:(Fe-S)-binding protein [Desulfovibrio sp.]